MLLSASIRCLAIKVHCNLEPAVDCIFVSSSQGVVVLVHIAPYLACSLETVAALTECAICQ